MLTQDDGSLYLEPGEVAALATALRGAGRRPVEHPEDVLLAAVADALGAMAGGAGVTCAPARDVAMREAARGFVSPGAAYWAPVRLPARHGPWERTPRDDKAAATLSPVTARAPTR